MHECNLEKFMKITIAGVFIRPITQLCGIEKCEFECVNLQCNTMQITEFPARLSQHKRVLREI